MSDKLQATAPESAERKVYAPPAIVHELKLETRAGSPLRPPSVVDPLGIDPTQPQTN
jgi:hypothetical protein